MLTLYPFSPGGPCGPCSPCDTSYSKQTMRVITQYGKQTNNNKNKCKHTNKQVSKQTNKQTNKHKQTNSKHVSSKWSTTSWCNYCLCALPLLLLVLESLVCLVHPFFPGRERKKAGRERERDNDYFVYLDSSDCLTVVPLEPLDPATPLDPCMQRCSTLFNLSSFVMINFFSSPSFHLFLSSLLLRAVPWGPCSPSGLGAPLSQ